MRYLYFQPKPTLGASTKWSTRRHNIASLLQNCSNREGLRQIHAQMVRTQLIQDTFLASRLVAFLTLHSSPTNMAYAHDVLEQIPHPNLFIWNSMIRGYTAIGAPHDGLLVYKLMLLRGFSPDSYTCSVVTRACAQLNALRLGKTIHGLVIRYGFDSDMFVMSGFINLYSTCGEIGIAREIFDEMPQRDVVSWTSMVAGYAQSNCWDEAFVLLDEMKAAGVEPNSVTVVSLLSACRQLRDLDTGRWIHSYIVGNEMKCDVAVGNSLVSMYAKCGSVSNAFKMFENMPLRNNVTWNVLIGGFVQSGCYAEALTTFQDMTHSDVLPDAITIVSALSACTQLGDLQQGKLLHTYVVDRNIICDVVVDNALVNMYAKCGDLKKAESIFLGMKKKDVISWTAMISAYVQGNHCQEALDLFEEMELSNLEANEVTLVSLLSACAQLGALDQGKKLHSYLVENKVSEDVSLGTALVDMYAKCGCIEIASEVFHQMPCKDILSWNVMIGGLAAHGHGNKAIELFKQMEKIGGTKPDHVTLLSVLCACSHSGMLHEGFYYFSSMSKLYGIVPGVEHYGCMVDLLGRAGLIVEAIDFISKMPIKPNSVIWGSLLAACRVHHNMELAEEVVQHMIELAPAEEGVHVVISNFYAEAGRWDDVRRVRAFMGGKGIEKSPGCSSIELNGVVHEFFVGDKSLHQNHLMCLVLNGLGLHLKQSIWTNEISLMMLQFS